MPLVPVTATPTIITSDPSIINFSLYTVIDEPGSYDYKTFMTVTNPMGSGVIIGISRLIVSAWSVRPDLVHPGASLRVGRAAYVSGGTVVPTADLYTLVSGRPSTAAMARVGNPTITSEGVITVLPAPSGGDVVFAQSLAASGPHEVSPLLPGETFAIYKPTGHPEHRWSITLGWIDLPLYE